MKHTLSTPAALRCWMPFTRRRNREWVLRPGR